MADLTDLRALARRAVDLAVRLTTRAVRWALVVVAVAVVVAVGSFALGLAALDGTAETLWIVVGGTFAAIAFGASALAAWRLTAVRRHATELVEELVGLMERQPSARRTVIDTVEVGESGQSSVVVSSQRFSSFGTVIGGQVQDFPRLAASVTAVTTFPFLLLVSLGISVVFALIAPIFLVALAV